MTSEESVAIEEWSEPIVVDTDNAVSKNIVEPIYKEWFKTKSKAGFIGITPWLTNSDGTNVGKITVEVGDVDPNEKKVLSSTKCYPNALDFYTYLNTILYAPDGFGKQAYPARSQTSSPESFLMYGGSASSGISRLFKVEWWPGTTDGSGFIWKCGAFKGKVTGTGAIEPDFNSPISVDSIKRTRLEMFRIHTRLQLLLHGWAAENPKWYE